jgi:hypothetical protein
MRPHPDHLRASAATMQRAAGQPGRLRLSFQVVFFFSNNSFLYPSYLGAPASCRQITINSGSAGILPANYYQFWERRHPAGKLLSIAATILVALLFNLSWPAEEHKT